MKSGARKHAVVLSILNICRQLVAETAERTVAAWEKLEQADLLPNDIRTAIGKQILAVAKSATAKGA
jgi:hypothetical protein